jgi:hypothetical protein
VTGGSYLTISNIGVICIHAEIYFKLLVLYI